MLLDGHKVSFDNFLILLEQSNPFKLQLKESLLISRDKLQLKESLLISRDKSIFNKNIYSLELFD